MLVYKKIQLLSIVILSLMCCSVYSNDLPLYDDLVKVYDKNEQHIKKFAEVISHETEDFKLQYLSGSLSYKSTGDVWVEYFGPGKKDYSELMAKLQVRFAGLSAGKIYLGGMSKQLPEKLVIVELVKYQGKVSERDCKSVFLSGNNGSCVSPIRDGWGAHYSWVGFK